MGFFKFDLDSDKTVFFLALAVFLLLFSVILAKVTGRAGRRGGGGRGSYVKHDDQIIDRNREIID